MGLVNQLGSFSNETAYAAHQLRDLLKPRNHWQWTPVPQQTFEAVKQALTQPSVLAYFNANQPTALHTDATRLHDLGYCLIQHQQRQQINRGSSSAVRASSRTLNPGTPQ